jgi:hypothetical protein
MAISAIPIVPVQTISGNQFNANRYTEEASQTALYGTPTQIASGDGGWEEWAGTAATDGGTFISGITYEAFHGYGALGVAPLPFQPVVTAGSTTTFGSVINQPSAINIPMGAPFTDGRIGVWLPTLDTVFVAMFGNNGNPATPAITDVGANYGLTIDSNSKYWYVDKNKTNTDAVVQIVALDPREIPAAGTNVFFKFIPAAVVVAGA